MPFPNNTQFKHIGTSTTPRGGTEYYVAGTIGGGANLRQDENTISLENSHWCWGNLNRASVLAFGAWGDNAAGVQSAFFSDSSAVQVEVTVTPVFRAEDRQDYTIVVDHEEMETEIAFVDTSGVVVAGPVTVTTALRALQSTVINVPTAHTTDLLVRVQATSQTGTGSIFAVRVFEDSTSI